MVAYGGAPITNQVPVLLMMCSIVTPGILIAAYLLTYFLFGSYCGSFQFKLSMFFFSVWNFNNIYCHKLFFTFVYTVRMKWYMAINVKYFSCIVPQGRKGALTLMLLLESLCWLFKCNKNRYGVFFC